MLSLPKFRTARPNSALRRQAPLVIAVTALGVLAGLALDLAHPAAYRSDVAAAYDEAGGAPLPGGALVARTSRAASAVAAAAAARLADPEFLWQVAKAADLTRERPFAGPLLAYLRVHVPLGTHLFASPAGKELIDDAHNKARLAAWLSARLTPRFDGQAGLLALTATADDPLTAKRLAEAAMEQLIQAELRFEADSAGRRRVAAEAWLKAHPAAGAPRPEAGAAEDASQGHADMTPLHTREMELLDRIQVARNELDQLKARTAARRATLMTELARLKTRLQPSHPDIIAKKEELRALKREPGERALRTRLEALQGELARVRAEKRQGEPEAGSQAAAAPGPGVGAAGTLGAPPSAGSVGGGAPAGDGAVSDAAFDRTLAAWTSQLALEHDLLAKEAEDPAARTRLRLVVPATYDDQPLRTRRLPATPLLGLAGLLIGAGAGLARARRRPLPATPETVAGSLGLPLLGTLPLAAGAAEATAAARQLELALRRRLRGNTVLVQQAGGAGRPGRALRQLLTVVGTDTPLAQLLVDCDPREPVVPAAERDGPADFAAFLTGKAPWKEARLARTAERPFDLVALAPGSAETLRLGRLFRPDTLAKLFQGLGRTYGRVYVRGPEQALETAALGEALTDSVLLVDLTEAADAATLARAVQAADPGKLRGVVVLTG